MKKLKGLGQLSIAAFVLVLVGCYVYSTGSVTVSIEPTIDCTRISSIKVEVYSGSSDRYLAGDSFDCSLRQVTVEDIPIGSNRRVVVSAIAIDDTLRYQGEIGNITISRNETTDVGVISLSRVGTNEVPVATIIQPQEGETIPFGKEIIFEGSGDDPEDGQLTGSNLQWESDIDGPIGEGTQFTVNDLSLGEHTITLSVTDNEDGVGMATTRITISSELENSIGMDFKLIPAGTFTMGSPEDEPGREDDEQQHQVTLPHPFYIQTTEVTQKQWEAVMGEGTNPSYYTNCGDDCPVERTTWYDSVLFCNRLSQLEGLRPSYYADSSYTIVFDGTPPVTSGNVYLNQDANGYRLPTEAQWEYAARSRSTIAFANGDIEFYEIMGTCNFDPKLDAMGWYCGNKGPGYGPKLVAQKDANAWGLFDMHGNVLEWCQDWYADYPSGAVTDPTGPTEGSSRVFRGGSWNDIARRCRSARRGGYDPGLRLDGLGFRLALPPVYSTGSVTVSIDPTIDCTRLSSMKVDVYSDSTDRYLAGDSFDCSLGQVKVEDIPIGSNRRVVVSAVAIDYTLRYQGELGNITIYRNETTDVGVISLTIVETSELENSIGMDFKLIPAGTFTMGSPEDELGREDDEQQHEVTLSRPYYIQTTEVTQGQWKSVMGAGTNPSYYPECGDGCPVEVVSWYDSVLFCNRLSQKEGLTPSYYADSAYTILFVGTPPVTSGDVYWKQDANGYRLPTEAEWEYAARAGSTTAFANGPITRMYCDPDPKLIAMGWYCYNSSNVLHTRPVALKDSDAWGLFDMHGNVNEWCQDWYGDYPSGAVTDPTGPTVGSNRVFRGGGWGQGTMYSRAASRTGEWPPGFRHREVGFRLALPTSQPSK